MAPPTLDHHTLILARPLDLNPTPASFASSSLQPNSLRLTFPPCMIAPRQGTHNHPPVRKEARDANPILHLLGFSSLILLDEECVVIDAATTKRYTYVPFSSKEAVEDAVAAGDDTRRSPTGGLLHERYARDGHEEKSPPSSRFKVTPYSTHIGLMGSFRWPIPGVRW